MSPNLRDNLRTVRERLALAAARVGRDPAAITLVAVTKTASPERAAELLDLGQVDLGESRLDGLERKAERLQTLAARPRWHFLGHLQRNKARRVLSFAPVLHSLDSLELLAALEHEAARIEREIEAYVEIKLSSEPSKTGLAPAALAGLLEAARAAPRVRLLGLMTLAPLVPDDQAAQEAQSRSTFRQLVALARALERAPASASAFAHGRVRTSMGMSTDFEWAVEEGSDVVRVGSALFLGLDGQRSAA